MPVRLNVDMGWIALYHENQAKKTSFSSAAERDRSRFPGLVRARKGKP